MEKKNQELTQLLLNHGADTEARSQVSVCNVMYVQSEIIGCSGVIQPLRLPAGVGQQILCHYF